MDERKLKDEVINYVKNASEETNAKIAIFIARMQAQKNMSNYQRKSDNCHIKKSEGMSSTTINVL